MTSIYNSKANQNSKRQSEKNQASSSKKSSDQSNNTKCLCGSGKKWKHCCGKAYNELSVQKFSSYKKLNPRRRKAVAAFKDCLFTYSHVRGKRLDEPIITVNKQGETIIKKKNVNKPAPCDVLTDRLRHKFVFTNNEGWKSHDQPTGKDWQRNLDPNDVLILYGWNSGNLNKTYVVPLIDLDPIDGANLEGFVAILENELEFNVYWEVSPSGGYHGYFFISKQGMNVEEVHAVFDSLGDRLKSLVVKHGWSDRIAESDVYGRPHKIDWLNYEVEQQYAFMQFPQEIDMDDRGREFLNASVVPAGYFLSEDFLRETQKNFKQGGKKAKIQTGSTGLRQCLVSEEDFDVLPVYRHMAARLDLPNIQCGHERVVTQEDWAICLMILFALDRVPNDDFAQPHNRIEKTWRLLCGLGLVSRQFHGARFFVMKQYLSDLGFIDYVDRNYWVGYWQDEETYIKGQCAKWHITEDLHLEFDLALRSYVSSDTPKEEEREPLVSVRTIEIREMNLTPYLIRNFLTSDLRLHIQEQQIYKIITPWPLAA